MAGTRSRPGRRGARPSELAARLARTGSTMPPRPAAVDLQDEDDGPVVGPWAGLAAARKRQADALAGRFTQATPVHSTARRSQ